jgi:ATP-dependent DNA helicase PIF1
MSTFKFTKKQQEAYDLVMQGKNVFLTGEGGTGKSEVIKRVKQNCTKKVVITSTTGTSALLLGGTTLHSFLGIGLGDGCVDWILEHKILNKKYITKRWRTRGLLLVIDEVSMLSPELFDKLSEIAKRVRKCQKPWGGIQLLLSGDFLQLPVVNSDLFTFQAQRWNESIHKTVCLDENVRQSKDVLYGGILSRIRMGEHTQDDIDELNKRHNVKLTNSGLSFTKLYTTNWKVDQENSRNLDRLNNEADDLMFMQYDMKVTTDPLDKVPQWIIDKAIKDCVAPEEVLLCPGAQVMLLVNIFEGEGENKTLVLSNGSIGKVVSFRQADDVPIVSFPDDVVQERAIGDNLWEIRRPEKSKQKNPDFIITQIPLRLAYAITIHKSQGSTMTCAEIDIQNCFCPGQGYVALSRVKSLNGLSLKTKVRMEDIKADPTCVKFYKAHEKGVPWSSDDGQEAKVESDVKSKLSFF